MLKEDVTAITIAELVLFLLFVVLIVLYVTPPLSPGSNETEVMEESKDDKLRRLGLCVDRYKEKIHEYEKMLEKLRKYKGLPEKVLKKDIEIGRLGAEIGKLRKNLIENEKAADRKGLRSKQMPTCKEIVKGDAFLATVLIISANWFLIDGKEYNFDELTKHFHDDLEFAKRYGCRHCVKVVMKEDLSMRDFDSGKTKLERLFYTKRAGFQ